VYSNALLASLNARSVIRGQIKDVDTNFHVKSIPARTRISRDVFARPNGNGHGEPEGTATELSIHIAHETELYYEDEAYAKAGRPLVRFHPHSGPV